MQKGVKNMMGKICKYCYQPFEGDRDNFYCSEDCGEKAKTKILACFSGITQNSKKEIQTDCLIKDFIHEKFFEIHNICFTNNLKIDIESDFLLISNQWSFICRLNFGGPYKDYLFIMKNNELALINPKEETLYNFTEKDKVKRYDFINYIMIELRSFINKKSIK